MATSRPGRMLWLLKRLVDTTKTERSARSARSGAQEAQEAQEAGTCSGAGCRTAAVSHFNSKIFRVL